MQYLYQKRIVHRDLKSSNILVDPVDSSAMAKKGYLRVKVTDFGLAKIKAATATFSAQSEVGTTRWMAPELHTSSHIGESSEPGSNKKHHPFKADVYSYAITCSEILTGDDPFMGEPLTGLRDRIKYTGLRPSLPDSLPPYLVSLIHRCWDADPCNRPDFSEICAELRHVKASLLIGMYTISS
jgi:serine/threonine protein kinase